MNNPQPTLWSSLRALPRPAWILCFGTFLNKFGAFVVPFLTLYLVSRGYSISQAGVAVSAYGVGSLVASLLGGYLADRLGRRNTIVLSMFCGAGAMLLLSQAYSLPFIIGLTGLAGLASEFYRPASVALLTDLVASNQRVTAFAALRMAFNAGFAFGPATAGFLAAYGYFWLFAGDAATSVLFGLVAVLALPQGVRSPQNHTGWAEALKVARRDHRLHRLVAANLAIGLVFFQVASTLGLYVTHLGFSPVIYGALVSLNGALVVFCELPLTTFTRRFPARRVMALGYLVIGIGFALNAFAHSVPALVMCMTIFTLGEMITMPMASAYLAELAPAHMRGRYMGMSGLTWSMGFIIGPIVGMRLFAFHPTTLWLACGGLGALAAIIILAPIKAPKVEPALPNEALS